MAIARRSASGAVAAGSIMGSTLGAPPAVMLLLQASIFLTVVCFGIQTRPEDVGAVLRRPGMIGRAFLAMFVIVPAAAVAMSLAFQLRPAVEVAIVALGISPMPPLLPRRQISAGGRLSYGIGLLMLATTVSIAFIPGALVVIGWAIGQPMTMHPGAVLRLVSLSVLLPLVVGMLLRRFVPRLAQPIGTRGPAIALVGLLVAVAVIIISMLPAALTLVGNGTLAAIAMFIAVGLAAGHTLGGPGREERVVLALSCACRHPVIAMAVAGANYPQETLVPAAVLLYLLMNVILSVPYIAWQRRLWLAEQGQAQLAT